MPDQFNQNDSFHLQRMRTILDSASDAYLLHDIEGKILDVNKILCNWLGYEKLELLKLNISEIDCRSMYLNHSLWQKIVSKNSTEIIESYFRRKDGSKFPIEAKLSVLDESGNKFIITFVRNNNLYKQSLVAPDLTQYALDNAANPTFWYKASDPKFFYVNQATCDYLGYTQKELLTMWTGDINPTYTLQTFHDVIKKLSEQHSLLFETEHITKARKIVPVEVLVKMVVFEGEGYVISFVRDITQRKQSEQELKIEKEKAVQANKAKSAFLANMSHEIRTPLTAIIGFSDTALHDNKTLEQRIYALKTIRRSGDHLLHLINDILDFSKIEADEMDIETESVNIFRLIFEVESMISGQAKRKNLEFHVEYELPLPESIQSDALRIKQILLNLCSNAIKFSEKGSVKIKLLYDAIDNKLDLQVIDTGIGLSSEQVEKIFEPFKQADATTTRRYGGTGLGLSLSRRLANLLGGDLTVNSEIGKGSIFQLSLPLVIKDSSPENMVFNLDQLNFLDEDVNGLKERRKLTGSILLAEDDALNQELISVYLEEMGATVTLAENGKIAVMLAQQNSYDLVYMDMQMPLLSGYEAVKELRKLNYTAPIVMLTANATLEDRTRCKSVGSNDFVTKPIDEEKLFEITAKYLKSEG